MNPPDIEAAFLNLTSTLDLEPSEPEALDSAVQAILDHFFTLLATIGDVNLLDKDILEQKIQVITDKINRFISNSAELTYDTEVIVEGGTLVLMVDENDGSVEANFLDKNSQIYGTVVGLYVGAVPDENVLLGIEERIESDEEYEEGPVIPFGLAMLLENPILSDHGGGAQSIPKELTVCIPLNYSSLRLKKA